jgi:hypothetical protein
MSRVESGHAWPLFDLRLRTPQLELRSPTDDDLEELCGVVRRGLHDPHEIVSEHPSWEELPSSAFELSFGQHLEPKSSVIVPVPRNVSERG